MRIAILTNEYPPNVYGGAGVHVENLVRELARAENGTHSVEVLCFGDQGESSDGLKVRGIPPRPRFGFQDDRIEKLAGVLTRNIAMSGTLAPADIIHCHTWYTHFAGCCLKNLQGAPLVLTTHSLEPHRPWKEEQLGPAYKVTGWLEKTAYHNADGVIAVSGSMASDVRKLYGVLPRKTRVIYNGIDPSLYLPAPEPLVPRKYGIDPDKPFLLFVGRITRQKGIVHLVRSLRHIHRGIQIVLCAGAPDTPEIELEMKSAVEMARGETDNPIFWIPEFLPKKEIIALYSMAYLFVCPSIYEPFGLINIEAMACSTPVIGSAVGGIREIIVHGETGLLVPFDPVGPENPEPHDPERYALNLADAVNQLLASPDLAGEMGRRGRKRVEDVFSWKSIALQTLDFYRELLASHAR